MAVVLSHGRVLSFKATSGLVLERPLMSRTFWPSPTRRPHRRALQTAATPNQHRKKNDFAFAFESVPPSPFCPQTPYCPPDPPLTPPSPSLSIDGVLLRSAQPLPGATRALQYLQAQRIPFVLLTNGGGKPEAARVAELTHRLGVPLDPGLFVQSHTPFADLVHGTARQPPLRDACVLVTGGHGDRCRRVAEDYGFTRVITPADIVAAHPTIWPFAHDFQTHYAAQARPLPSPHPTPSTITPPPPDLKVDAILIFNDPRDWALDTQLLLDLLLSHRGHLGTVSARNGDAALPNRGYQQDGQPALYFSNPDLLFAAAWPLPRLGQGAFHAALRGVWGAVTGGAELRCRVFGKPHAVAYEFAERRLEAHRAAVLGLGKGEKRGDGGKLKRVYMVGDNPASDILGANAFESPQGTEWRSVLVRSGVYGGERPPAVVPDVVVDGVWEAVRWGVESEGWEVEDG
ncbi:hypothetical protein MMC32_000159 [Xylographa parallela]|nr:hypothetical protein [Xylographa parallela]